MNKFLIFLFFSATLVLLLMGCSIIGEKDNSCEYQQLLNRKESKSLVYSDKVVGVSREDEILIVDFQTCNRVTVEKSEALRHRPIFDLKKIDEASFSFIISAQPHFGHYYEYDLNGVQLATNTLVDECYVIDQLPEKLQGKANKKCQTNPELKTYEELVEDLKKNK